jgi:hypothetical protein
VALTYPLDVVRDVERRWQQRVRRPGAAAQFIRNLPNGSIIAMGGSGSGGLDDIQELLEHLPADLAAIVLLSFIARLMKSATCARCLIAGQRFPSKSPRMENGSRLAIATLGNQVNTSCLEAAHLRSSSMIPEMYTGTAR